MLDLKSERKVKELKKKLLTKKLKNGKLWVFEELNNIGIAYLVVSMLYIDTHIKHTQDYKRALDNWNRATSEEHTQTNLAMQDLMKKLNNEMKEKRGNKNEKRY